MIYTLYIYILYVLYIHSQTTVDYVCKGVRMEAEVETFTHVYWNQVRNVYSIVVRVQSSADIFIYCTYIFYVYVIYIIYKCENTCRKYGQIRVGRKCMVCSLKLCVGHSSRD